MVTMGIEKYTSEKTTAFNQVLDNWENALLLAGKLLEENGDINHQYTLDMIEMVKNEGPYIVVTPGIALAHARPNGNVNRNSIAIVTSCKDIWLVTQAMIQYVLLSLLLQLMIYAFKIVSKCGRTTNGN